MTTTLGCCSKHGVQWHEDGECIECGIVRESEEAALDDMETRLDACVQRMEKIISALEAALKPIGESHGTRIAG